MEGRYDTLLALRNELDEQIDRLVDQYTLFEKNKAPKAKDICNGKIEVLDSLRARVEVALSHRRNVWQTIKGTPPPVMLPSMQK